MHDGTSTGDDPGQLLGAVAAGDREAIRQLYQMHASRLFGVAMAILRDREAAADAVQDGFLRLAQRAHQFDPARGTAEVWIGAIIRNAALDRARSRGREIPSNDPALGDRMLEPEALRSLERSAEGRRLRDCLSALDPRNRDPILLAFVRGLSHAEISGRLDQPLGTVKAWIRRGLARLKDCLA